MCEAFDNTEKVRKILFRLTLGIALVAIWVPGLAQADMLSYMTSIGVPNPVTNDVLFFSWNPIVPPTATSELADLGVLNFGLAMYEVGSQLRFTFVNGVATPVTSSVITDIYFDDGSATEDGVLFDTGTWVADSGDGVDFDYGPTGDLPEWEALDPDFDATENLSWSRVSQGGVANGINALPEYLTVGYNYIAPANFDNIVSTFLNGTVRIGMHVQSIGTGGWSESVIWSPIAGDTPPGPGPYTPVVPIPGAAGLGLLGMGLVALLCRMKGSASL